jgi:anaerobic ribonucleoside-triphosphate reductase activating protein
MTTVALSRLHFPITTLGPGRRIGLWLQGCSIRCPGCISVDTWEARAGTVALHSVTDQLARLAPLADGLTVSGGEPFDQPEALVALLERWREVSDQSVFVFTGYEIDRVSPWLAAHANLVDAMMTGPFRSDLAQTRALRGSDNQTLHVFSPAGMTFLAYERPADDSDRRLDVAFDRNGEAWMAGIPARGDLARLRRLLAAAGHAAQTSDRTWQGDAV